MAGVFIYNNLHSYHIPNTSKYIELNYREASFNLQYCFVYVTLTLGVMKNVLDFVHQITEESTSHFAAVRDLIWITVEV